MRLLLGRLGHALFVLWAVATLTFLVFRLMPGDPTLNFLSESFSEEMRAALLASFGLDRPLHEQYGLYLLSLVQGDFGISFLQKRPVADILMEALPNTVALTVTALLVAYAFGIVAGAFLAFARGTLIEGVAIPAALATRAAPEFWLGMILLSWLSFAWGIFPSGGAGVAGAEHASEWARMTSLDFLRHLALPAITLALYLQGLPLLLMRATMLEVLNDEFIVMARMKGLSRWAIVMRHAARNALLPVATAFALGLGQSFGGNVVIEQVFSWPGLGRVLVGAVQGADYPLAQGAFILIAFVLVLMNTVADLLYAWLDPRVSVGAKR
ncbi:ABC transporter permease [Roseomonas sp. OT10]|uniref:ABC transporter permease n=1 Tax=Roseomonas cutis TaxID=2897332 RepID=UPI001E4F3CD4|nr:ABC transporter permease [Roseomonas sp. OT10]UFN48921.1 ABC transporter permease [Roseomonas sp. OT10]